jgi:hypothetical protein
MSRSTRRLLLVILCFGALGAGLGVLLIRVKFASLLLAVVLLIGFVAAEQI